MKNLALFFVILVAAARPTDSASSEQRPEQGRKGVQYAAPDGGMRVVVIPAGREVGLAEYESRVRFESKDGKLLCSLDYSSEDNEHGFGVVKAEWTPDSMYFVFSLTSSGGHQSWHAPTQFYNRKAGTVRTLDDYFEAAGISNADFKLVAPNTVKTEVWEGNPVAVSIKLSSLPRVRSRGKAKQFSASCLGGRVFKVEDP